MEKFNSRQPDRNDSMQRALNKISDFSDEQILREFEEAMNSTSPLPLSPPPENEFDQICRRIEAESLQLTDILMWESVRKGTFHAKSKRKN